VTASDDYLEQATRYITCPRQAEETRRELRAHLVQFVEVLQEGGLDSTTAVAAALARMGPPEAVALDLAEVHHRHLPWRLYLAPLFLGGISLCLWHWWPSDRAWELAERWLPLLLFSLWPDRSSWGRPVRLIRLDVRAKWHWLQRQMWDRALITGGATGGVAGLVWGAIPHWYQYPKDYMVLFPLVAALLVAWVQRRSLPCPPILTACCATLAFPIGYLPGYLRWGHQVNDWPIMIAFFTISFGLTTLAAGWIAQIAEAKGWGQRRATPGND
jgi:hypothetical protein